ncbi:hypothetical protein EDB19DRAFT_2039518, partial [Suillus lakei]
SAEQFRSLPLHYSFCVSIALCYYFHLSYSSWISQTYSLHSRYVTIGTASPRLSQHECIKSAIKIL